MKTVQSEWTRLNNRRQPMLTRCEGYASLTLPRIMERIGDDETNSTVNRDHQSVGAQGVNHLANKLMLTMFAPSRPFIRFAMKATALAAAIAAGLNELEIQDATFEGEMRAVRELDNKPVRPKLHETLLHLIVTGNALLKLPKDGDATVYGLRDYVVQRTRDGQWHTLILCREHKFEDLEADLRAHVQATTNNRFTPDSPVKLYTHVVRRDGRVTEQLYVDEILVDLPKYQGDLDEKESEWHPLVWNLRSGAHYGTGHVEDLSGDLAALSTLSKAQVEAAILASEFRWLLRPGAQTTSTDLEESANGSVLPGEKDDLNLLHANIGQSLAVVKDTAEQYIRRIGFGFIMNSAVTRDAERVTTEEIRQQAQELETSLGGVYSRLAGTLQLAVARWLLIETNIKIKDTDFDLQIVTGLDALSRNGDLAALRGALADIASLAQLQGPAAGALKMDAIIRAIFMGWGVRPSQFIKTAQEMEADQQQAEQAAARMSAADAVAKQQGNQPQ